MTDSRVPAAAVLCAVALLAVAVPMVGAATSGATDGADRAPTNSTNDSSMGAEISAFMQSSASEADGAVEDGMFEAEYDERAGDDRAALVEDRTGDLQADLAELRERKRELQENRDEMSRVEYQARMSRLVSDIRSLERSVERTEPLAERAGVNATALRSIRDNASELSGQEVAALARGMSVVPDERPDRGPDGDRGNGEANGREGGPGENPGNGPDDANPNSNANDQRNENRSDDGDDDDDDGGNGGNAGGNGDNGGGNGGGPDNGRLIV